MALCALLLMGASSCKRQGGEVLPPATEKGTIRIEQFEGIERGKGLSGEVLLSVSNGLRSDITLTSAEIGVCYGDKSICTLVLNGEVAVPKRVLSSVRVPVSLSVANPLAAYGLLGKIMRGEVEKVTLTVDAEAKVGIIHKHIYKEKIPLHEALRMAGIPTDGLKALVK